MSVNELIERYGVAEHVEVSGKRLPIINIPLMSDERWQQLAKENNKVTPLRAHKNAG